MRKFLLTAVLLCLPMAAVAQVADPVKVPLTDVRARMRVGVGVDRVWSDVGLPGWRIKVPISYGISKHFGVTYKLDYDWDKGQFGHSLGATFVVWGGH